MKLKEDTLYRFQCDNPGCGRKVTCKDSEGFRVLTVSDAGGAASSKWAIRINWGVLTADVKHACSFECAGKILLLLMNVSENELTVWEVPSDPEGETAWPPADPPEGSEEAEDLRRLRERAAQSVKAVDPEIGRAAWLSL